MLGHDALDHEETNRERTDDIALHPELGLARRAARELDPEARTDAVMYTGTEPCSKCAGGIAIAEIGGGVYGVSACRLSDEFGGPRAFPAAKNSIDGAARFRWSGASSKTRGWRSTASPDRVWVITTPSSMSV